MIMITITITVRQDKRENSSTKNLRVAATQAVRTLRFEVRGADFILVR